MSKTRHPEKIKKPINPIKKKPDWIRSKIIDSQIFFKTKEVLLSLNETGIGIYMNFLLPPFCFLK